MNYCRECGKILDENQTECPFCGTHLGNEKVKEEADLTDNMLNQSDASPSMDKIDNTFEYGVDSSESKKDYMYSTTTDYDYSSMGGSGTMNNNPYDVPASEPLNNWVKILLAFFTATPAIGPFIGIIAGIVFMIKEDQDRKTTGQALLTVGIISLVVNCCCAFAVFSQTLSEMSTFY